MVHEVERMWYNTPLPSLVFIKFWQNFITNFKIMWKWPVSGFYYAPCLSWGCCGQGKWPRIFAWQQKWNRQALIILTFVQCFRILRFKELWYTSLHWVSIASLVDQLFLFSWGWGQVSDRRALRPGHIVNKDYCRNLNPRFWPSDRRIFHWFECGIIQ